MLKITRAGHTSSGGVTARWEEISPERYYFEKGNRNRIIRENISIKGIALLPRLHSDHYLLADMIPFIHRFDRYL